MFGCRAKIGLASACVPHDEINLGRFPYEAMFGWYENRIVCGQCSTVLLFGENVNNDGKCLNCKRQENIVNERKRSRESLDKQAAKMLKLSNQIFSKVQVGTTIRVPIPDVDRARASPRNVLAVVSDVEDGLYKLCTTHGVLKHKFTRSEFNPCMEKFILLENLNNPRRFKT
ncbi:hypothetical protein QE152_g19428 [Popillia japonica]|uniref:Uncharacterized protein n=1 Tax=Popillia japonica TaxID=7064 RepID=A0AAW1KQE0_POPJA